MREFTISASVTISIYTKVEAEDEKEALRIAGDREGIEQARAFDTDLEQYVWIADDYDGEPENLRIENSSQQ